jgi:hypothetical protein
VGLERDTEQVTELTIEVHRSRLRMFDGADDDVAHGLEALSEKTESDTFAGAGIAGS